MVMSGQPDSGQICTMAMLFSILIFLLCTAVIVFSGTRLSRYGDKIAELTGMGRAWTGLILMASVTSLPELITGISSVTIVGAPDLAAGDIFGSCVFNLLILSVLDWQLGKPLFSYVRTGHLVAAVYGIILFSIAAMGIFLSYRGISLLWVSGFSLLLVMIYLIAIRSIYLYEQRDHTTEAFENGGEQADKQSLRNAIKGYVIHAVVVIAAALFLPFAGEQIAAASGLGNSFFGTLFLAASTSLPELVVSLAALRIGAVDMAVGNLLGSNVFNMFILALDDIFYTKTSLFSAITPTHLVSVLVMIVMSAVVMLGLLFKPRRKAFLKFGADTLVLVVLYLLLMSYLFIKK